MLISVLKRKLSYTNLKEVYLITIERYSEIIEVKYGAKPYDLSLIHNDELTLGNKCQFNRYCGESYLFFPESNCLNTHEALNVIQKEIGDIDINELSVHDRGSLRFSSDDEEVLEKIYWDYWKRSK